MNNDKKLIIKTAILVTLSLLCLQGLIKYFTKTTIPTPPLPKVIIAKPLLKNISAYITQTGTVVSFNSVNLVARIEGYLEQINFKDGSFVKQGQGLFVIEPKPYLEQLKAAEAVIAVQTASYQYNKSEYARQQQMYKQNATSLNNVEKWSAKTIASEAEIAKAKANAEIAAINYSYTHVASPFTGRIGRHLIDVGNLVGNGKATDLATIQQLDPIYVYFNLNELDLIKIRAAARAKVFKTTELNKIPVHVRMQNENKFLHQGTLDFVNTALNASTGTMEFRAILHNKDYTLLPGLFVEVQIPITALKPQLTIADSAIQYDQIGSYVFILKNQIVVQRRIEIGASAQGMRAVTKGLNAQDELIVGGLQNAIPGIKVMAIKMSNHNDI